MFFTRSRPKPDAAALAGALRGPDPRARCRAARWLGGLRDRSAVPALIAALADEHVGVRRAAMGALERLREPLPALVVQQVWRGNAEAALLARDRQLLPALLLPLRQGDISARCAAAAALGRLGDGRATLPLAAALRDPIMEVRRAAVKALGDLRDPRALPSLLALLHDGEVRQAGVPGRDLRRSVVLALGWLGDSQALPVLGAALQEPELAAPAAVALGVLGNRQACPALVRALMDPDEAVRRAAASALGLLQDRLAAGALIGLLTDPSGAVRREAAAALARLGDTRLAELARAVALGLPEQVNALGDEWKSSLLRALLFDARAETRLRAARLLGELGDPVAIPDLRAHSKWWSESDARVRHACREAIEAIHHASGAVGSEAVPSVPREGGGQEGAAWRE